MDWLKIFFQISPDSPLRLILSPTDLYPLTHSRLLFLWPENLCLGRAHVMEKISASPLGYNPLNQPPPLVPFFLNWSGNLQGLGICKFLLCLKSVKQLLLSLRVKFSVCRNSVMSWESNTWKFLCKSYAKIRQIPSQGQGFQHRSFMAPGAERVSVEA